MKRSCVAGAVLTSVLAGSAMAADLPAKAPAYAAPFSWTGFYVGAHVGWGWGKNEWSDRCALQDDLTCTHPIAGPAGSYNLNGFLGGGQVGFNWQSGWAVFGVEADASWSDIKGSGPCDVLQQCSSKIDALGTITGRFGRAIEHALFYVKGGGAWLHEKHTIENPNIGPSSNAQWDSTGDTKWGWTVGAGVEYAFAPNWSGKVEYDFLDFGKDTQAFVRSCHACTSVGDNLNLRQTVHAIKLGINYRFGGPVAARY